jgi:RNA polymerase sigma factor (sigma-70 family)
MATLSDPDADVDVLIRTAQGVGEHAHQNNILDFVRYATMALFKSSRRAKKAHLLTRENQLTITGNAKLPSRLVDNTHKAIEYKVLVSEILKTLSPVEKDVLLRFTYGMKHPQIAAELNITVGMSRQYLSRARKHLTELLGGMK